MTYLTTDEARERITPEAWGEQAAFLRRALASESLTVTAPAACWWRESSPEHAACEITRLSIAMRTRGKAHRMTFTLHTGDMKVYSGARPACGSTASGYNFRGEIVAAVTCERCRPM